MNTAKKGGRKVDLLGSDNKILKWNAMDFLLVLGSF